MKIHGLGFTGLERVLDLFYMFVLKALHCRAGVRGGLLIEILSLLIHAIFYYRLRTICNNHV